MSLTHIDLGISIIGDSPNPKDQRYVHITRSDVVQRIKKHPAIDTWTKEYLYKRVNEYPDSALVFFVQNINQIVACALNDRNRIMKEQHDENKKKLAACKNEPVESEQEGLGERGAGVDEAGSEEIPQEERESFFTKRPGG